MKVVIVIPTYNEAENINKFIHEVYEVSKKFPHHQTHLLVVDDNSPDGTGEKVKKIQKKMHNLHLITGEKKGLGQAYLRGMNFAIKELNAEILFQIDADFQHDPKVIPTFIEKIDEGNDFVIGSRYIKGGSIPQNWGIFRKFFSIIGNLIVRVGLFTLNIHDWTSGYRAIRSHLFTNSEEALKNFNGYTFQIAFLYNAVKLNSKISEVPIHFEERKFGKSKIGSEYVKNAILYIIKVRLKETFSPRFIKFALVGGLGLILQTIIFEVLGVFLRVTSPSVATIIGGQVALVSNFILNNLWTFKDKKIKNPFKLVYKFLLYWSTSNFAIVVLQGGSLKIGELIVGDDKLLIQLFFIIGIGLTTIWNYAVYNRFVWKTHK